LWSLFGRYGGGAKGQTAGGTTIGITFGKDKKGRQSYIDIALPTL